MTKRKTQRKRHLSEQEKHLAREKQARDERKKERTETLSTRGNGHTPTSPSPILVPEKTDPMQTPRKICGAKTRSGGKCQNRPMKNGRCRLHGGLVPGGAVHATYGNTFGFKHGLHSQTVNALEDDERALYEAIIEQYRERYDLDDLIDSNTLHRWALSYIFRERYLYKCAQGEETLDPELLDKFDANLTRLEKNLHLTKQQRKADSGAKDKPLNLAELAPLAIEAVKAMGMLPAAFQDKVEPETVPCEVISDGKTSDFDNPEDEKTDT